MKYRGCNFGAIAVSGLLVGGWLPWQGSAGTLPTAATGASVDESRVTKVLYVDPAHTEAADDKEHGTANAPFATLGFACEAAAKAKDANVGVKIILAAGTYREEPVIRPPAADATDTDAPLVIEAAEREQAVIDGADTEGWSPSTWTVDGPRWAHPWPYRRAEAKSPAKASPKAAGQLAFRGDLVVVNGTLLRQVNAAPDLAPGCFWTMPAATTRKRHGEKGGGNAELLAVVQPPEETELPAAIIQVGVRSHGLTITGRRNVVVRGLLLQHAADPNGTGGETAGLVLKDCANVLVEDVLSQWNDGAGLLITGRADASAGWTLRRVRLLHNGGSGLEVSSVQNLLAEDNETSFNNFRGELSGAADTSEVAAVRADAVRGSTWRRQQAVGNACRGLWLAGGDTDVTIEDAVVKDNGDVGVGVINDPGPVLVRRCLIAGTRERPGARDPAMFPAGILLADTPDVTLESNVVAGNASVQLGLLTAGGEGHSERHVYHHNVFFGTEAGQSLYRLPATGLDNYYATLAAGQNCFWNPEKAEVFEGYSTRAATRRTPAVSTTRGSKMEDWQVEVGGPGGPSKVEADSRWQDPLFADPQEGDYRLKKASPVADWDLPSDEAAAGQ